MYDVLQSRTVDYDPKSDSVMILAFVLSGSISSLDCLLKVYEDDIDGFCTDLDPRTYSLAESLCVWRKRVIGGNLKAWHPRIERDAMITGAAMRSVVADMLLSLRMATEYEYGHEPDVKTFVGWTIEELQDIARLYKPLDIERQGNL